MVANVKKSTIRQIIWKNTQPLCVPYHDYYGHKKLINKNDKGLNLSLIDHPATEMKGNSVEQIDEKETAYQRMWLSAFFFFSPKNVDNILLQTPNLSNMNVQVCHCGWTKYITYHGLRVHQGLKGCTAKGMRIPQSEQSRFPHKPSYNEPQIKVKEPFYGSFQDFW